MRIAPSIVFGSSLALVSYTYLGYPLAIFAWSRLRERAPRRGTSLPHVSVVLAAHDEEARIGQKLDDLLAADYPEERLEIIVVSDGSRDGTDEIVASYADRGVILERVDQASGKPTALNRGVARATGEVVVFCDARQRIEPGAIRALVAAFADEEVGAVSGELHMPGEQGPGVYWRYEKLIRAAESRVDSVVGATGALYAIRRELFRDLPPDCLLDDVYTPMQIVMRGYRVLFEPEARVHDVEASTAGEFARKARTLAGNYQLLQSLPQVLSPSRNRILLQFASHKLLRLACPFALAALVGSNALMVARRGPGWPLFGVFLAAQLAGYGLALSGALRGERAGKLARVSLTFVTLNAAAVEGLRRFLVGDTSWTTARGATRT
jgi:poly-beta-1,6-N-acetyl-D-glucosamine synthase